MPRKKSNWKFYAGLLIGFVAALAVFFAGMGMNFASQIAVIRVSGTITSSPSFLEESVTPDSFRSLVEEAENNPSIKAVLIQINSPGGSVVASREMVSVVKGMKKPSICWLGDIAASGAYWLASSCDHIMADPLSLTGSIGVTASYLSFSGLFDKYGIKYEQITSGESKDIGTPFRNMTEEERKKMEYIVDETYKYFITDITDSRNLTPDQIMQVENGDIFLGKDAVDLGLVDSLGSFSDAKDKAMQIAGIDNADFVVLQPKGLSILDLLSL